MNLTSIPTRVSAGLLSVILLIFYFLILTPIVWLRRKNHNVILGLNDANSTGWIDNEQSSTDLNSYVTMASGRDDLVQHVRAGGDTLVLFCYDTLMKFRLLARPPKEKELRSDLYVMF
jgi:hypothetical protein